LLWRDLQRDEVTRSCGGANDLTDASEAQNTIAAVSAPFDALRRQHDPGLDPPLKLFAQSRARVVFSHARSGSFAAAPIK
jgi:hypothetical protein